MKRTKRIIQLTLFMLLILCLSIGSCGKDDPAPSPIDEGGDDNPDTELVVSNGVTADDFELYKGDLGIVINTRNIAKKGYKPVKAEVTVNAANGDFSQTVELDDVAHLGQIKLAVSELSEEAVTELKEGVDISVKVTDENDNEIISKDISAVIFSENATPTELNVTELEETEEVKTIALSEDTSYYVQVVDDSGSPQEMAMRVNRTAGFDDILTRSSNPTWQGIDVEPDYIFNFIPVENEVNTYFIQVPEYGRFVGVSNDNDKLVKMFGFNTIEDVLNASTTEFYKFIVEKVADGKYIFRSKITGETLKVIGGVGMAAANNGNETYWRIISNTLEWSTSQIGIKFLEPIMGKPATSFGANSTLTNCGNGSLEQTIGSDQSETIVNTIGWEERFSLTGAVSTSVTATIGMEVEAGFFGNSATYSAELSSTTEASVSMTEESSSFGETQEEVQEAIFFERTVTVPSGSASLVYDVAQIYANTKVQFVQRVRLKATESGIPLSGETLRSQLQFSKFNGVVTEVGPDFLDISIKGTATLGKVFETQSTVEDVPSNCN